jgi:glyoxylase-like metal-dependent hydrolase (beta-lactamase superfamily II)
MNVKGLLTLLLTLLAGCASSGPESQLINNTVAAVGGADAINAVNTLVLEGTGDAYNLGQNSRPDAELPRFEVTKYRKAIDFSNMQWRQELVRIPRYVTANTDPQTQITAIDNGIGFNVAVNQNVDRQSELDSRARHAQLYHHPVGVLQLALDRDSQISDPRTVGTEQSVRIVASDGTELTLYVDRETGLPSRVQSMAYYGRHLGDVFIETHFEDYENVDGLQLPTTLTSMLDRFELLTVTVSSSVNGDTSDLEAPDEVKSGSVPVPSAIVEVEEIGRGLWYLTGQSHNSLVVEFEDHMTLVEAPQDDIRTLAVIDAARSLNPDKPLTEVINTHHHFDHSGGMRAAMSEGLTVITHEFNREFFKNSVSRSHQSAPDALARNPQAIQIETVSEPYELSDAGRTVQIFPIVDSPHADTLLMVYFPAERALVVADVYSTPNPNAANPRFPHVANLIENIENYGLRVDRVLPIHGQSEPFLNVTRAAQAEARAAEGTDTSESRFDSEVPIP